jgi:hypothetical protein
MTLSPGLPRGIGRRHESELRAHCRARGTVPDDLITVALGVEPLVVFWSCLMTVCASVAALGAVERLSTRSHTVPPCSVTPRVMDVGVAFLCAVCAMSGPGHAQRRHLRSVIRSASPMPPGSPSSLLGVRHQAWEDTSTNRTAILPRVAFE